MASKLSNDPSDEEINEWLREVLRNEDLQPLPKTPDNTKQESLSEILKKVKK